MSTSTPAYFTSCWCQCREMQGPGWVQLLTVQHPSSASPPTHFTHQMPKHSPRRHQPNISGAASCSPWAGSINAKPLLYRWAIAIPAYSLSFHTRGFLLPCPSTPAKAPAWYALQLLPNRRYSLSDWHFLWNKRNTAGAGLPVCQHAQLSTSRGPGSPSKTCWIALVNKRSVSEQQNSSAFQGRNPKCCQSCLASVRWIHLHSKSKQSCNLGRIQPLAGRSMPQRLGSK